MSIAQKALRLVMRPLLNERHRTGMTVGQSQNQKEWEAWLQRRQEAGVTWPADDPPPGGPSG